MQLFIEHTGTMIRRSTSRTTTFRPLLLCVAIPNIICPASCRKETLSIPQSSTLPTTIEQLDPLFRVPGFEDKIDIHYGLPLHGVVARSVRYDLDATYAATVFRTTLERHLKTMGCTRSDFTFSNPSLPSPQAETWRIVAGAQTGDETFEQWWVRSGVLVCVVGHYLLAPDFAPTHRGHVHVMIAEYYPTESRRYIEEYERAHGELRIDEPKSASTTQSNSAPPREVP
jgi:hypothetical protein